MEDRAPRNRSVRRQRDEKSRDLPRAMDTTAAETQEKGAAYKKRSRTKPRQVNSRKEGEVLVYRVKQKPAENKENDVPVKKQQQQQPAKPVE